jgi:hypothetical protein
VTADYIPRLLCDQCGLEVVGYPTDFIEDLRRRKLWQRTPTGGDICPECHPPIPTQETPSS